MIWRKIKMNKYWVSWYSSEDEEMGCTNPPFQAWLTGYTSNDEHTLCGLFNAESEEDIWNLIEEYYPDYTERFCEIREDDFQPSDRFPNAVAYTVEKDENGNIKVV
jgi:hypothetical protein